MEDIGGKNGRICRKEDEEPRVMGEEAVSLNRVGMLIRLAIIH
jgi:hypothetical protein